MLVFLPSEVSISVYYWMTPFQSIFDPLVRISKLVFTFGHKNPVLCELEKLQINIYGRE